MDAAVIERTGAPEAGVDGAQQATIAAALRRLDPAQRQLLEMAFYSGLTHTELAARSGLPLGTVKTRLRAALAKMRNLLEEQERSV
jgi:RNA polymerase sigma-70 factor (ECF subfamily)